jgi:hypothetical protein
LLYQFHLDTTNENDAIHIDEAVSYEKLSVASSTRSRNSSQSVTSNGLDLRKVSSSNHEYISLHCHRQFNETTPSRVNNTADHQELHSLDCPINQNVIPTSPRQDTQSKICLNKTR